MLMRGGNLWLPFRSANGKDELPHGINFVFGPSELPPHGRASTEPSFGGVSPAVSANMTIDTFGYNAVVNRDIAWWPQPLTVGNSQVRGAVYGEVEAAQYSVTIYHDVAVQDAVFNERVPEDTHGAE